MRRDEDDDEQIGRILSRRETLALLGGAAGVFLVACGSDKKTATANQTPTTAGSPSSTSAPVGPPTTRAATATTQVATPSCVVRPEATEGPYFVDEKLNRGDIRSDPSTGAISEGTPLTIVFRVARVAAAGCTALGGATVDVWHCDAAGVYSDVSANRSVGKKFLRGYQVTDANGTSTFTTVYPGWYMGRAVHVHFKIRTAQGQTFTSQLFFDEATTDRVFAQAPYAAHGRRDTTNTSDGIFRSQLLLPVAADGPGYTGTFDIGLQA